jgi:UDP-GlcNAc:undecaprenyl-phosphate GlcNAc-1-phosphate transferase
MTPSQRLLLFLTAALWLLLLPPLVDRLLVRLRLLRPNYRGQIIPVGYGLVILLWSAPVLAALFRFLPGLRRELAAYLLILAGMALLGFADDLWGDRRATGLRGHLRKFLIEGEITTGFVKAAGGLALALLVPRYTLERTWPDALLDGLLIALCANALNLLDLRPGRACAVFLLGALAVMAVPLLNGSAPPLAFVAIPALLVWERDARARVMLGDTGSNLLGGALGLAFTLAVRSPFVRGSLLAGLLLLHLVAERRSLTALIEANPFLRRLDRLTGRR